MSNNQSNFKLVVSAEDKVSSAFRSISQSTQGLIGNFNALNGILGTAGLGAALTAGATSTSAFEKELFNLTKVTDSSISAIENQIKGLDSSLGNFTELTAGYYQTLSSGVTNPVKALETLTTASKLAAVSGTTQEEAIKALTKMMAGYRGEIENVSVAADTLLDIEQFGQATVKELIPIIGDLSGVSQTAGVSFQEMAGSLALLTQTSGSVAGAETQLSSLIEEFIAPSEKLKELINVLGYETGAELVSENGLVGALKLVEETAKASGEQITDFIGSSEAIKAFGSLATNEYKTLENNIDNIGKAAGRTEKSFEKYQKTAEASFKNFKNTLTNTSVLFGKGFLPEVTEGANSLTEIITQNQENIIDLGETAGEAFTDLLSGLTKITGFVNSLPDEITGPAGLGILGYALFGAKGAGLLATVGIANELSKAAVASIGDDDINSLVLAFAQGSQSDAINFALTNNNDLTDILEGKGETESERILRKEKESYAELISEREKLTNELANMEKYLLEKMQNPTNSIESEYALSNLEKVIESRKVQLEKINQELQVERDKIEADERAFLQRERSSYSPIGIDNISENNPVNNSENTPVNTENTNGVKGSALEAQLNLLDELENKTKALLLTEYEYAKYTFQKEIDDLRANLPSTFESEIQKYADLGFADLLKQENERIIEQNEELKQQEQEIFNSRLEMVENIASLSGDYILSLQLQSEAIIAQAEAMRTANPELTTYVDEWERLALLQNQNEQAQAKRDLPFTLRRTELESEENYSSPLAGFELALLDATEDTFAFRDTVKSTFTQAFDDIGETGKNMFVDVFDTGGKNAGDFVEDLGRSIFELSAQLLTSGVFKLLLSLGTGGIGGAAASIGEGVIDAGSNILANVAHTGGIIGKVNTHRLVNSSIFNNAPRYHSGYDPATEQPAILLKNERVLNPAETIAYNAGMSANSNYSNSVAPIVNVVINNSSQVPNAKIKTTQTINSQGELEFNSVVVAIVKSDIDNQGSIYSSINNIGSQTIRR